MSGVGKRLLPIFIMTVRGQSMTPFAVQGQRVVVRRLLFQKPRIGDVVVAQHPQRNAMLLKRITNIQNNAYCIEGDNPARSTDSRHFGAVSEKHIIGKVIKVW